MRRAYRMLLRLYPRDYRADFEDEMTSVFARQAAEHRTRGWRCYLHFLLHECIGVMINAARAQPVWVHIVPVAGGLAVAALLHLTLYAAMFKLFDLVARAVGNVSFSAREPIAPVVAVTLFVATLLLLLPLFFLLSMRLLRRTR